ncbi:MAG: carbohydrate ABC transporter permease [Spirochaetes bacterium]|nr:carbohydrate ABC transporter permease [Spirochaetota bacterium]
MSNLPLPAVGGERVAGMRSRLPEIVITVILLVFAATVIIPLVLPFFFVFKTRLEYNYNPWALPTALHWENFRDAWNAIKIGQGFLNTLAVCAGAIAITVPISAMAGYIFARYRNRITEVVFYLVLMGYFVPMQMVLIPLARTSAIVGLIDTLPGLFLPMAAFGVPFWTMIYRSFYRDLPEELADAARIDGAGHSGTFFRIMLPLANPATILAVILVFMSAWSDYLLTLVMINSQARFTIQLRVAQFLNAYGVDHMPQYSAAVIIAVLPTILLYILCHRWIIRGTLAGALKG